jgi:hypothetical protein
MKTRTAFLVIVLVMLMAGAVWASPSLSVADQAVKDDTVVIASATSDGPGWIAIHIDNNGSPGPVVGHAAVKDGLNTNVVVGIDPYRATPRLQAMLHVDKGQVGVYEFPGADVPVVSGGMMVSPAFTVSGLDPRVLVSAQSLAGGSVTIAELISAGPGWLVIHIDAAGKPGPVIGYAPVAAGLTRNLVVKIDVAKATPTLYAMLHVDAGKVGTYEFPGADVPVMVDGAMVSPGFTATK